MLGCLAVVGYSHIIWHCLTLCARSQEDASDGYCSICVRWRGKKFLLSEVVNVTVNKWMTEFWTNLPAVAPLLTCAEQAERVGCALVGHVVLLAASRHPRLSSHHRGRFWIHPHASVFTDHSTPFSLVWTGLKLTWLVCFLCFSNCPGKRAPKWKLLPLALQMINR